MMRYILLIGLIFGTEYFVKKHMDRVRGLDEQRGIMNGKAVLKKYYNTGTAGDFLSRSPRTALCLHAVVFCMVLACMLRCFWKKGAPAAKIGYALLAGGGLSNLSDRVKKGHVVDYVSFRFGPGWFQKLVFNGADLCVFAGILILMIEACRKEGRS